MFVSDILKDNLVVIEERWPQIRELIGAARLDSFNVEVEQGTLLVNDIQLTSGYDRKAEAKLQCEQIPQDSPVAYVYGVGLGDVPLCLLERKRIKSIVVCVLNVDILLHVLNALDHTDWLKDPRIELVYSDKMKDVYEPFIGLPTELRFSDDKSATLRDRIVLELNHKHLMNKHTLDNEAAKKQINDNLPSIVKDESVGALFSTYQHKRVYIAAAGPTLNEHIALLKANQKLKCTSLVIALDASIKALLAENIIPDVVVSIDAEGQQIFTDVNFSLLKNTQLVYFPRISPKLIESWVGKRFCAYSYGSVFKEVNQKYPKSQLHSSGSVIHVAVDLAIKMGGSEIVLLGADFGFPGGEAYVKGQDYNYTKQYVNSSHWVLNGKGERISTMLNYRGYLRDLERYIETKPHVKFINGSAEGANIAGTTLLK